MKPQLKLEIQIHKVTVEPSRQIDAKQPMPLSEGIFGEKYVSQVRIVNGTLRHESCIDGKRFDEFAPRIIEQIRTFNESHPPARQDGSIYELNLSMQCEGSVSESVMPSPDGGLRVKTTTKPLDAAETHYFFRAMENVLQFLNDVSKRVRNEQQA